MSNKLLALPVTTPFSPECFGDLPDIGSPVSTNIATNNLAYLYPWLPETPTKFVKAFVVNGGTIAGNIDVGIYDSAFNRLVSHGGAAQTGANSIQEFDITDTWFNPGQYWMAFSMSNSSGTVQSYTTNDERDVASLAILEATTAYPLPTTVSPVKTTRNTPLVALMGFCTNTLV